ncbi:YrhB domain-containing protein [Nocardioides aromaticivorans]|uniref:YrhB domain-containing protein n=1 Tax=Nocardioides aromaticivorans TaxID=200618 RepID=UPI001A8E132A|nr:YrhB domain-containing protein [Nocardioides aromaticivorans]
MDVEDARRLAEVELAHWNSKLTPNRLKDPHATAHDPEDEVVVTEVETHSRAWIVHFATRRWLRTRSVSDQLVGACPFVIDRITGELHTYGSGPDGHSAFVKWLDVPPT